MRVILSVIAVCGAVLAQQQNGWHYTKDDPHTKKPVLRIDAKSLEFRKDENALLQDMTARVYQADGLNFKEVKSDRASSQYETRDVELRTRSVEGDQAEKPEIIAKIQAAQAAT